ncbi:unnamed protein product [Prorocentrum cordatum]|uniref:EF-hand domain-containing protein n=1 Tax=Prorocentrum cordatum TaxID=2364126 RepID=A0ABN9X498_9DINO|nr:unnamed protein product [Polarella glacialis]
MKKLGIDKATALQLLKDADLDADEKLSPEEYQGLEGTAKKLKGQQRLFQDNDAKVQQRFSKADTDDSGFIDSKTEFNNLIQRGMKKLGIDKATALQLLKDADLDADEKLSPEEYQGLEGTTKKLKGQQRLLQDDDAKAQQRFSKADMDDSGSIDNKVEFK